ncbi:apoptotic chromatin condensation inducer acinus isoform X2 [Tachypleus tridentatus]
MAHENSVKSGKKTGLTKKQVVDTKEDKCTTKTVKEFSKSISKTKSFKKDSYSSVGQKSEETDVSRKDGECSPSSLIVDPDIPESSKSQTCRKSRNRSRERNGNKQHKSSSSVSSSSSRSSRSSSCSRSSSQNSGQSSRRNSSRSSSRSRSSSPESQQEKNRNKKSRSQSSTPEPNVNDVDSKDRVITVSYEKKEEPESVVNEKFSPARDVDILEVTVDEHKKEIIEEGIQAKEEKKRPPINLTPRRLSVRGNKDRETVKSDEISQPRRKRKWATSMNSIPKVSLSISTDALKNLLPEDVPETPPTPENPSPDPVPNSESANSPEDGPPPPKREIKLKRPEIKIEPRAPSKEPEEVNDAPLEEVEIVEIKENKEHTPSPAKNPKSNIIFIRNLVRPFTLLQLKDLLAKTGTLVDGGFWIDKIKSKCCVTYETEEQAEETRKALHGVQWPISNPKTLIVDFATKEELDQYLYEEIPPIKKTVLTEDKSKEHKHRDEWLGDRKKAKDVEENERKKEKNRSVRQRITAPIREWDVGKLPLESPERDEEKKRLREKEKDRSAEKKKEKKDSRHKQEEETSAKLLDDLFRKTKTTPCIYWLPLTEEQIQSRIEERKQRQVERERRRREEEDMRSQRKEKSRGSRSRSRSPATRRR